MRQKRRSAGTSHGRAIVALLMLANGLGIVTLVLRPEVASANRGEAAMWTEVWSSASRLVKPQERRVPVLVAFIRDRETVNLDQLCRSMPTTGEPPVWFIVHQAQPPTLEPEHCKNLSIQLIAPRPGRLVDQFGARAEWGRWFLFDRQGVLFRSADLIQAGVAGAFLDVARNEGERLSFERDIGAMASHKTLVEGDDHRRQAFLFVNYASTGCSVAGRIRAFAAAAKVRGGMAVSLVVPREWPGSSDIGLQQAFQLDLPIHRPTEAVQRTWDDLRLKHGLDATNGVLVVRGRDGTVEALGSDAGAITLFLRSLGVE